MNPLVLFCTVESKKTGETISRALLEKKLAACVNIIPGIESYYWWENKIQSGNELLLVIKSSEELFDNIEETILQLHPYDVPEIVALPLVKGHAPYMQWIHDSISK